MNREPFFKEVDGKWYIWDAEKERYLEDTEDENKDE